MQVILGFDKYIINLFQGIHNPLLDKFFSFVTTLGNVGIVWVIISVMLLCIKKYRRAGFVSLVSLIIGALVGNVFLKNMFQRPRPFITMEGIKTVISYPTAYSFPSGHSTASFTAMFGVVNNVDFKYIKATVIILAILIAISRVYLGVHYFTDILAGFVLGFICYKISEKIIYKSRLEI